MLPLRQGQVPDQQSRGMADIYPRSTKGLHTAVPKLD
jgi:hypothetical protein